VGAKEVVSPQGEGIKGLENINNEFLQNGYTTALSAWLMLAPPGMGLIGGTRSSPGSKYKRKDVSKDPSTSCSRDVFYDGDKQNCTENYLANLNSETAPILFETFGAKNRWCSVMKELRSKPRNATKFNDGKNSVSKTIAAYLGYDDAAQFNCGVSAANGCKVALSCPKSNDDPATVMILTSLINLSAVSFDISILQACTHNAQFSQKLNEGWESALLHSFGYSDNLRESFAPNRKEKDDMVVRVLLDVLTFGFGAITAGLWHNVRLH
jgi:hypothetical protein